MTSLLALFLVGCAPQDAVMTGDWTTWLAANSSDSVREKKLDLTKATRIDCSGRTSDDPDYIGSTDPNFDCTKVAALQYNTWLQDDGFYRMGGGLSTDKNEVWRTDALINSEGDFQLSFHMNLDNNGEDFRAAFSIKPDFAPVTCTADADGNPEIVYQDGANWLDEWSRHPQDAGYKVYYLNAGAAQTNPSDSNVFWYFTTDWAAGYSDARFSADNFGSIPTAYDWSDPSAQTGKSCKTGTLDRLFYWSNYFDPTCETGHGSTPEDLSAAIATDLGSADHAGTPATPDAPAVQGAWATEMTDVYGAPGFDFKIEDNSWRTIDDAHQGIDGWVDLNTSWVRIKDTSDLEVGGSAEGDFQIYYYAADSDSALLVKGTFSVDKIKGDPWGYPDLEDELRSQNDTPYCDGAAMPNAK